MSGRPSTTRAMDGDRSIYFTDLVYEGEVVDVYETMEQAEMDEGPHRKMRVCRDGDDWWLEAHPAAAVGEGTTP